MFRGRRALSLPDNLSYQSEVHGGDFVLSPRERTRRVKHLTNTLNQVWGRWGYEHFLEACEAHQFGNIGSSESTIVANDTVVFYVEGQPRGFWRLATVENLIVGRCGGIKSG